MAMLSNDACVIHKTILVQLTLLLIAFSSKLTISPNDVLLLPSQGSEKWPPPDQKNVQESRWCYFSFESLHGPALNVMSLLESSTNFFIPLPLKNYNTLKRCQTSACD